MSQFSYSIFDENFFLVDKLVIGLKDYSIDSVVWDSYFNKDDNVGFNIIASDINIKIINDILNRKTLYMVDNISKRVGVLYTKKIEALSLECGGVGIGDLLSKRICADKNYIDVNKTAGETICQIINDNNPYAWLEAVEEDNVIGKKIVVQTKMGDTVLKHLQSVCKLANLGYRFLWNEQKKKVVLSFYEPHTEEPDYRLGTDVGNVIQEAFDYDYSKLFNYCVVVGENQEKVFVGESNPEKRYEFVYKSKSKKYSMTDEEYLELLRTEGLQQIASRQEELNFNLELKEDSPNLGDLVMITSGTYGFKQFQNITGIKRSFSSDGEKLSYDFGFKRSSKDLTKLTIEEYNE